MTGYTITNLKKLIGHPDIGEDLCKEILSGFSCPLNGDVENFIGFFDLKLQNYIVYMHGIRLQCGGRHRVPHH